MGAADDIGIRVVHRNQAGGREAFGDEPGGAAGIGCRAAPLDLRTERHGQRRVACHSAEQAVARRLRLGVSGRGAGERCERQPAGDDAVESSTRGERFDQ